MKYTFLGLDADEWEAWSLSTGEWPYSQMAGRSLRPDDVQDGIVAMLRCQDPPRTARSPE